MTALGHSAACPLQNIGFFDIGKSVLAASASQSVEAGRIVPWLPQQAYVLLGDCLAEVRRDAGATQTELAARLGKPQSFVSAYESGQRRIDVLELLVILSTLSADSAPVLERIVAVTRHALPLERAKRTGRR